MVLHADAGIDPVILLAEVVVHRKAVVGKTFQKHFFILLLNTDYAIQRWARQLSHEDIKVTSFANNAVKCKQAMLYERSPCEQVHIKCLV